MYARQIRVREGDLRDCGSGPGDHVDDAGGQPCLLKQVGEKTGGELLGPSWLPDNGISHQRRSCGEVTGNGSEVEWCDGIHKTFEGTVVNPIPDSSRRDRLVSQNLASEKDIEPPKVDQLTSSIDLSLNHSL